MPFSIGASLTCTEPTEGNLVDEGTERFTIAVRFASELTCAHIYTSLVRHQQDRASYNNEQEGPPKAAIKIWPPTSITKHRDLLQHQKNFLYKDEEDKAYNNNNNYNNNYNNKR